MKKRKVKIEGWGYALPKNPVSFGGQTRYRLVEGEDMMDLVELAARRALDKAGMGLRDVECIVCGMATPLQAIPCNAALTHERLARSYGLKSLDIPAMDINTTCTSFIASLDLVSCLIGMGRYERVLIVSGDRATAALNPSQRESYELFSDGAAAMVIARSGEDEGAMILYGGQKTWSEGAHDTEIRGGGGLRPAFEMNEGNREDYYFDMKGSRILKLSARKLPGFLENGLREAGIGRDDIDVVVPHQASKALGVIMPRLGFPKESYLDYVSGYGNMISASVPFAFCKGEEEGKIKRGDVVLLLGTAAGLTASMVVLRF